jgi:proline dehydrogenase
MITLSKAIKKINPNAEFKYLEEDINSIEWLNGTTPIPKADIEAKMTELQAEYDANEYQRVRATAYPSIQEQLDMQYWDKVNGTTNWEDAIAKTKSDIPKP